jgi:hypothetical protein
VVAVVATSAVWGAVLADIGRTSDRSPDLRGYRIPGNTCTTANLRPFTEALGLQRFDADPGIVLRGPVLDHVSCVLSGTASAGDGWITQYAATVTVDLHKKTDPRAEFEDAGRVRSPEHVVAGQGTYASPTAPDVAKPVTGLGDMAFSSLSDTRQAISVLDGDVVVSLAIDGIHQWQGTGTPPATDGALLRPAEADTKFLRPALVPTMRQLMGALTSHSES